MRYKMAYLGPRGTFCEEAARCYTDPANWELCPYTAIDQVFAAVHHGEADRGIVPIENSCEGSVTQTMKLLAYEYDLNLAGEIILPVSHNLLVRPGVKPETISRILSHPQALAQCRRYLSVNFGSLEIVDLTSTAEAARRVAESSEAWAAIGTAAAARAYGLDIAGSAIHDHAYNETRFIILARASRPEPIHQDNSGLYKTSLLLYLLNKPGALFQALEQFYLYGINLTKIESRPAQTRIGEYLFFIDIEGHQGDHSVRQALSELKSLTYDVRILGSYKSAGRQKCQ
ncbi:MAG: prephenate dehydratase [Syntrophomonadaceae bacterium]|nr:prephenate dehydratase [Syntrophomonadaceae bacterium]